MIENKERLDRRATEHEANARPNALTEAERAVLISRMRNMLTAYHIEQNAHREKPAPVPSRWL
jgi:hypothetical protein